MFVAKPWTMTRSSCGPPSGAAICTWFRRTPLSSAVGTRELLHVTQQLELGHDLRLLVLAHAGGVVVACGTDRRRADHDRPALELLGREHGLGHLAFEVGGHRQAEAVEQRRADVGDV